MFRVVKAKVARSSRQILDIKDEVIGGQPVTAIIGKSGAGKSSLLRALMTSKTYRPFKRSELCILFQGRDLDNLNPLSLGTSRSYVPQIPESNLPLSVMDYLHTVSWLISRVSHRDISVDVQSVSEAVNIGHLMERRLNYLSGGERKLVDLARALLCIWQSRNHSQLHSVALLDEPLSGLDPVLKVKVSDLIIRLSRETGIRFICSTHNMDFCKRVDEVIIIRDGRFIENGLKSSEFTNQHMRIAYGDEIE